MALFFGRMEILYNGKSPLVNSTGSLFHEIFFCLIVYAVSCVFLCGFLSILFSVLKNIYCVH